MAAALPQFATDIPSSTAHSPAGAEFDLLLACCADFLKTESSSKERGKQIEDAIERGVDWDSLARMASHHGMLPLVFKRLASHSASIPTDALANLRRLEQVNSRRTLWLTSELLRVAENFEKQKIGFLAYKGPTLGQLLHGDVTARQFGDLDLMVRAADVPRAVTTADELGYRSQLKLTTLQEQTYLATGYEYSFNSDFGRNLLEIKWQILPHFYAVDFNIEKIFTNAGSVEVGGRPIPSFNAGDLLLVLCVHAAKHGWEKLSWLYDIAMLPARGSLDWNTIYRQACTTGIERILAINFVLANKFFGAVIPGPIFRCLEKDKAVDTLVKKIAVDVVDCKNSDFARWAYFRRFASLRERRRDRTRFWWRLLATPGVGEWKTVDISNPRSPLFVESGCIVWPEK